MLRTTLKFRRVKPETFLSKAWGVFRGLVPAKQRVVAAGMAILLLFAAVGIGIASAQDKGTTNAENSATKSTESAVVNVTPTPSLTPTSSEETDQVINAENNKDFATLLVATDYCDPSMAQFAAKYQGQKIEFDGSITNMQKYDTGTTSLWAPATQGRRTLRAPRSSTRT